MWASLSEIWAAMPQVRLHLLYHYQPRLPNTTAQGILDLWPAGHPLLKYGNGLMGMRFIRESVRVAQSGPRPGISMKYLVVVSLGLAPHPPSYQTVDWLPAVVPSRLQPYICLEYSKDIQARVDTFLHRLQLAPIAQWTAAAPLPCNPDRQVRLLLHTPLGRLEQDSIMRAVRRAWTSSHPALQEEIFVATSDIYDDPQAKTVKVSHPTDLHAFGHLWDEATSISPTYVLLRTRHTAAEWGAALAQDPESTIRALANRPILDRSGTWARAPRLTSSETAAWRPSALDVNEGLLLLQLSGPDNTFPSQVRDAVLQQLRASTGHAWPVSGGCPPGPGTCWVRMDTTWNGQVLLRVENAAQQQTLLHHLPLHHWETPVGIHRLTVASPGKAPGGDRRGSGRPPPSRSRR
jgi:hypothetical protein